MPVPDIVIVSDAPISTDALDELVGRFFEARRRVREITERLIATGEALP